MTYQIRKHPHKEYINKAHLIQVQQMIWPYFRQWPTKPNNVVYLLTKIPVWTFSHLSITTTIMIVKEFPIEKWWELKGHFLLNEIGYGDEFISSGHFVSGKRSGLNKFWSEAKLTKTCVKENKTWFQISANFDWTVTTMKTDNVNCKGRFDIKLALKTLFLQILTKV